MRFLIKVKEAFSHFHQALKPTVQRKTRIIGEKSSDFCLCLPVDMIPENALEEMTKNMDPNLVIVEAKDGVQMK